MSEETFAALLAPNLASVQRFVQTRLRKPDLADDVLQDTLLHAFDRRHQLRAPAKFKSWLCSIALNEVRMSFRRGRRTVSLEEFQHLDFPDREPSPLARAEQKERADWLQTAMATLSARDREAIRLRDLDERSLPETAATLRASCPATKTAHFRARQRLGHALRKIA